jgi:hypothetical protein
LLKGASIAMVLERAAFEIVVLEICHGVSWGISPVATSQFLGELTKSSKSQHFFL